MTINCEQAVNAQVDVLCHELAHVLVRVDRHDDDPQLGYAEEELVAESVAHLAVSFVGLDSSASAVPYLAGWAESAAPDTFEQIAELVDRLARRLENALGAEDAGQPARRGGRLNSWAGRGERRAGVLRTAGPSCHRGRERPRTGGGARDQSQAARARANPPRQLHPRFATDRPGAWSWRVRSTLARAVARLSPFTTPSEAQT